MKKLLLIALAAAGCLSAAARGLSPDDALQRALASEKTGPHRIGALAPQNLRLLYSGARLSTGDGNSFYVFGREKSGGYIIASGDDRLRPVLAIADSGEFNPQEMPESLKWWLGEYETEIAAYLATAPLAETQTDNVYDNYAAWTPIEPLVSTNWDQLSPFNTLCPVINGERTATGCVATAMAQIIHTLGYVQGKGTKTYTPGAYGKELSFNFANWKPDFSKMPDRLNAGSGSAAINEVATLMLACGIAVDMNYNVASKGGSGAGSPINGLKLYMGYDASSAMYARSAFTTPQWEKFIYDQLAIGRPVYYAGSSNTGGHAFVCDGYSSDGMFHFNWGWSGASNGYYTLSVLNPRQQGVGSFAGGYNLGHQAGIFVVPGTTPAPAVPTNRDPFNLEYIPSGGGDLPTPETNGNVDFFSMMYHFAMSPESKSYDVGISLLLKDPTGKNPDIFIEPNAYKTTYCSNQITWNFEADFAKTPVAPGTYCAYIAYTVKGFDGIWMANRAPKVANDHFRLTIDKDGKRTYAPEKTHGNGVEVYRFTTNELYADDKANTVDFLIANNSTTDFSETVSLRLFPAGSSDGSKATVLATSVLYLPAGEVRPISMSFAGQPAGKYTLRLYRDAIGDQLGNNSLDVSIKSGTRPGGKTQSTQGMIEIALWADNAHSPLTALDLTAGQPFSATTALNPYMAMNVDYSLAIFAHGQTYNPLKTYAIAKKQFSSSSDWVRGDDFTITPDLEPGLYTAAFVDANGLLLSYAVDCYVGVDAGGMSYRVDSGKATLVKAPANMEKADIPASISYGGKTYSVCAIADDVFSGNRSLTNVDIPASVTSIGLNAFKATTALQRVYFRGSVPPFENSLIPFQGVNSAAAFYVDPAAFDAHAAAFNSNCGLYALISSIQAPATATATVHSTTEVKLTVSPADHADPRYSVQVADPAIVSASAYGTTLSLTGLAQGSTVVTLTSLQPGVAPVSVKVDVAPYFGVTLDAETATIGLGETLQLTATTEPANLDLTWTSSDPAVATVDANGLVSAIGKGQAVITAASASHPEASASCTVSTVQYVTDFILEATEMTVKVGDRLQLQATPVPADADNAKFTWSSSDSSVAYISRSGALNARAAGTATLTVTASDGHGVKREIALTVTEASSIDQIEADADADAAEFFDLAGRKIANPGRGIFIRRSAGKSEIIRR